MAKRAGQVKLGAFLHPTGHHIAAWRYPDSYAAASVDFNHYAELARTVERGKFDLLFLADSPAMRNWPLERTSRVATYVAGFEPITLLSALSAVTRHIGLVATATTTYNEPFHVARKFASLDHISGGRAGWNLVTSVNIAEAFNFGREEHTEHDARYDRGLEFARVVRGLWDSWDDDAFVRNKEEGRFFDPARVHALNHKGEHFSVRGPLNVPRSPQGRPIIVQAGTSEVGQELSAEVADVVFAVTQTLEAAQKFSQSLKGRMAKFGREPDELKIMPGLVPFIGESQQEADDKFEKLQSLVHPEIGLQLLGEMLGHVDLSAYPLDGPLPEITTTIGSHTGLRVFTEMAKRENLTIRQLYMRVVLRGHCIVRGTPQKIADHIQEWFEGEGADGFNVMPPYLPGGLDDFVAKVVPELQRRGIFRKEYEGKTLRDNLGLRRPASRYAKKG
ncbi:MAG TPA: LLM class flavin-dependent oxidoreductase [Xanthobacteraceae bacterium]|nr:LLM class flavin-dependent oxidoreductase [Xanthobacteraceae bacterium]